MSPPVAQDIAAIRRFSRFYTQRIGALHEGLLDSPLSLTEGRVLYELGQRPTATAAELANDLGLDRGYLSRILRVFAERGLIDRQPSEADGRQTLLSLTEAGRALFGEIDARSHAEIGAMLDRLTAADRVRLVEALSTAEGLLAGEQGGSKNSCIIRPHRAGDLGWIVHRHGALYTEEYGWDSTFEALVAEIAAQFLRSFDPRREACWIAERAGEIVGSVLLVRHSDDVAKLRLLYVEPKARGLGVGRTLVDQCLDFARRAGYRTITLWTNDVLVAARRIYQAAGFRLAHEEPHHSFGHDLVAQTWERPL